jgi:hypothetical protein
LLFPSETACPDFVPDRQSQIHKKVSLLNSGQAQVSKTKVFVPPNLTGHSPNRLALLEEVKGVFNNMYNMNTYWRNVKRMTMITCLFIILYILNTA